MEKEGLQFNLDLVKEVAERIRPLINRTPCLPFLHLRDALGQQVYLKMENLQITGGFKLRGNANKLTRMPKREFADGVITASSGNHGLGMALSARRLRIPAVVVVGKSTPENKIEKLRTYGAQVIQYGENYNDAANYAQKKAEEENMYYVPSFDDPDIIIGNGTMGLEIFEDIPEVQTYICPIGGGGGISGSGLVLKNLNPNIRIIGVEAEGAASMCASFQAGEVVELESINTKAEGIAVSKPGTLPYTISREIVDEIVTVSDQDLFRTLRLMVEECKIVPELAGVASAAALVQGRIKNPAGPIVCLVSGGNIHSKILCDALLKA